MGQGTASTVEVKQSDVEGYVLMNVNWKMGLTGIKYSFTNQEFLVFMIEANKIKQKIINEIDAEIQQGKKHVE